MTFGVGKHAVETLDKLRSREMLDNSLFQFTDMLFLSCNYGPLGNVDIGLCNQELGVDIGKNRLANRPPPAERHPDIARQANERETEE